MNNAIKKLGHGSMSIIQTLLFCWGTIPDRVYRLHSSLDLENSIHDIIQRRGQ